MNRFTFEAGNIIHNALLDSYLEDKISKEEFNVLNEIMESYLRQAPAYTSHKQKVMVAVYICEAFSKGKFQNNEIKIEFAKPN